MEQKPANYEEWMSCVHSSIRNDPLWSFQVSRKRCFSMTWRGFGKDYSLHLRIAIFGEARESRGWYWRGRHCLPPEVVNHRIKLLDEIIAMLAPNISRQRNYKSK